MQRNKCSDDVKWNSTKIVQTRAPRNLPKLSELSLRCEDLRLERVQRLRLSTALRNERNKNHWISLKVPMDGNRSHTRTHSSARRKFLAGAKRFMLLKSFTIAINLTFCGWKSFKNYLISLLVRNYNIFT